MEVDSAAEVLQKMPRDKAASITRKMLVSSPQADVIYIYLNLKGGEKKRMLDLKARYEPSQETP